MTAARARLRSSMGAAALVLFVAVGVACERERAVEPVEPTALEPTPQPFGADRSPTGGAEEPSPVDELDETHADEAAMARISFNLEEAAIADTARILANITREPVVVSPALGRAGECVRIAVTSPEPIATQHAVELVRVALREVGVELTRSPHGYLLRPAIGRTPDCGRVGSARADRVPAPADPLEARPFADPEPDSFGLVIDGGSLEDLTVVLAEGSGDAFEIDAALESVARCIRIAIYGDEPLTEDHAVELVRVAVADANVELAPVQGGYVFRAIAGRAPSCSPER